MSSLTRFHLLINLTTICQVLCVPDLGLSARIQRWTKRIPPVLRRLIFQKASQAIEQVIVTVVRFYREVRSWPCNTGAEGKRNVKNNFFGEVLNECPRMKEVWFNNRKLVGERSGPGRRRAGAKIHSQERVRSVTETRSQIAHGRGRQRVVWDEEETRSHEAFYAMKKKKKLFL